MAAEEILKLFEKNWSKKSIFSEHRETTSDSPRQETNLEFLEIREKEDREKLQEPENPEEEEEEEEEEQDSSPTNVLGRRSMSDQNLMSSKTSLFGSLDDVFSPTSVLNMKMPQAKLQTIHSGKEVKEFLIDGEGQQKKSEEKENDDEDSKMKKKEQEGINLKRIRRRTKGSSKSLSDLEYEEIKGFMDLGFVFSEEAHKDSDLVSILPGLERLGKKINRDVGVEGGGGVGEEEEKGRNRISRPYLSEAWEFWGAGKGMKPPMAINWRVPVTGNEVDMKDHLRLWAHTVASTIR